jgi:hypothetical protein
MISVNDGFRAEGAGRPGKEAGIFFLALLSITLLPLACGKKAPPLPPVVFDLPVPADLSARVEGGTVILTWPMPDWDGPEGVEIDGFSVYRAKVDFETDCPDCPVAYSRVGKIDVDAVGIIIGGDLTYREELEKGYAYRYKVSTFTHSGMEGEASRAVLVSYP